MINSDTDAALNQNGLGLGSLTTVGNDIGAAVGAIVTPESTAAGVKGQVGQVQTDTEALLNKSGLALGSYVKDDKSTLGVGSIINKEGTNTALIGSLGQLLGVKVDATTTPILKGLLRGVSLPFLLSLSSLASLLTSLLLHSSSARTKLHSPSPLSHYSHRNFLPRLVSSLHGLPFTSLRSFQCFVCFVPSSVVPPLFFVFGSLKGGCLPSSLFISVLSLAVPQFYLSIYLSKHIVLRLND